MSKLEEIKEAYAKEKGWVKDFDWCIIYQEPSGFIKKHYDEISKRYAKAKLEEAAERAECKKEYYPNGVDYYYITEVDKQSITETPLD